MSLFKRKPKRKKGGWDFIVAKAFTTTPNNARRKAPKKVKRKFF